jgi:para-aminobenzoate synthetase component I
VDFALIDYFLFVPDLGKSQGTLHLLSPATKFESNSVVLLPYTNPQTKATQKLYFKIDKKIFIEDLSVLAQNKSQPLIKFTALTSKEKYLTTVKKLKQEIQLGNIYEINYCISFVAKEVAIDPLTVFLKLNAFAKAPYSCLLKVKDEFILCASPELFLKKENELLLTKPIKGTIRRGNNSEEDLKLKETLYNNLKERTENVMAVDVARNDLSRFAQKASVQVNQLYNIETFETVHQMVSTVSCNIHEDLLKCPAGEIFDTIIDATFPMASMTGAPKLRAMTLIEAYEDFERQFYSGAMGIIDNAGNFTLSVVIRSLFYNQNTHKISFAVGGAITYLSDPEKEYEECLLKAETMLKALNAAVIDF